MYGNICIFDIQNVNKYMLKNSVFIMILHNKYKIIFVSLHQFKSVIINSSKFLFSGSANSLEVKGFQAIGSLFLFVKKSLY